MSSHFYNVGLRRKVQQRELWAKWGSVLSCTHIFARSFASTSTVSLDEYTPLTLLCTTVGRPPYPRIRHRELKQISWNKMKTSGIAFLSRCWLISRITYRITRPLILSEDIKRGRVLACGKRCNFQFLQSPKSHLIDSAKNSWWTVSCGLLYPPIYCSLSPTTNRFLPLSSVTFRECGKSPSLCLPINCIMSLCHVPSAVIMWKLWFGAQGSLDIQGLLLHWISKREMKYWHCSFTHYRCSLHIGVVWVWRTLKLDSVVTTRVHQPLSFLRSLTISDIPEGPWFLHHTESFMLSVGSARLWVLKRKHWFSFISTGCATPLKGTLSERQDPTEVVCGGSDTEN